MNESRKAAGDLERLGLAQREGLNGAALSIDDTPTVPTCPSLQGPRLEVLPRSADLLCILNVAKFIHEHAVATRERGVGSHDEKLILRLEN